MKKLIILILLIKVNSVTFCQANNYSIEVTPFVRYDKQSSFFSWETVLNGKTYVSHKGVSYGINLNIRRQLNMQGSIFLGAGLYRHRITNIHRANDNYTGNDRLIKFPSPRFIPFLTDNYSYNTVSGNIGYQQELKIFKSNFLLIGANVSAVQTFSQKYHLTSNPGGSTIFRKSNSTFLGVLGGFDIGTPIKHGRWIIEPKIRIPVVTFLKTDSIFPNENGVDFRTQLFSGIGFGISFIYMLKTKKKIILTICRTKM